MALNIGQMVSEPRRMTVAEQRWEHAEVFGEPTRSHHKDYQVRRIASRVRHGEYFFNGEHGGSIDEGLIRRVQANLRLNGTTGGGHTRNKHGALLKRMVRCDACGCVVPQRFASKNGTRFRLPESDVDSRHASALGE